MENNHRQQNPKSQKISSSFLSNTSNNYIRRRKTETCLKFQRGSCNYGYRCCFIHTNANLLKPRLSDSTNKLCCWGYMNADTCPSVPLKPKLNNNNNNNNQNTNIAAAMPIPWKTKLCHGWVSFGTCKYGSNCSFAHGESELRKRGSDNTEGVSCKWVDKTCVKEVNGMRWEFKWDVDKISHVYGDWINDTPLVHVDTGNVPT